MYCMYCMGVCMLSPYSYGSRWVGEYIMERLDRKLDACAVQYVCMTVCKGL